MSFDSVSSLDVDVVHKEQSESHSSSSKGADHDLSGETAQIEDEDEHDDDSVTNRDERSEVEPEESGEASSEQLQDIGEISSSAPSANNSSSNFDLDIFSLVARQQQERLQKYRKQHYHQQQMLVLASLYGQAGNREGFAQQNHTFTILKAALGSDVPIWIVDASDPDNYPQRDALLEISGAGPVYPQFFLVKAKSEDKQTTMEDAGGDDDKESDDVDNVADNNSGDTDVAKVTEEEENSDMENLNTTNVNLNEYEDIQFFGDYQDLFTANERQTLRASFLMQRPLKTASTDSDAGEPTDKEDIDKKDDIVEPANEADDDENTPDMKTKKSTEATMQEPEIVESPPSLPGDEAEEETVEDCVDDEITQTAELLEANSIVESAEKEATRSDAKPIEEEAEQGGESSEMEEPSDNLQLAESSETRISDPVNLEEEDVVPAEASTPSETDFENSQEARTAVEPVDKDGEQSGSMLLIDDKNDEATHLTLGDSESPGSEATTDREEPRQEETETPPSSKTIPPVSAKGTEDNRKNLKKKMEASALSISRKKKDRAVLGSLEVPEWVETWMLLPTNPVVKFSENITQRVTEEKLVTTMEVTLTLRDGEQQTQSHSTITYM